MLILQQDSRNNKHNRIQTCRNIVFTERQSYSTALPNRTSDSCIIIVIIWPEAAKCVLASESSSPASLSDSSAKQHYKQEELPVF
jgi:hypothetical protein